MKRFFSIAFALVMGVMLTTAPTVYGQDDDEDVAPVTSASKSREAWQGGLGPDDSYRIELTYRQSHRDWVGLTDMRSGEDKRISTSTFGAELKIDFKVGGVGAANFLIGFEGWSRFTSDSDGTHRRHMSSPNPVDRKENVALLMFSLESWSDSGLQWHLRAGAGAGFLEFGKFGEEIFAAKADLMVSLDLNHGGSWGIGPGARFLGEFTSSRDQNNNLRGDLQVMFRWTVPDTVEVRAYGLLKGSNEVTSHKLYTSDVNLLEAGGGIEIIFGNILTLGGSFVQTGDSHVSQEVRPNASGYSQTTASDSLSGRTHEFEGYFSLDVTALIEALTSKKKD